MPLARLAILTAVLTAGAGAHPDIKKLQAELVPQRVKHPGKPAS